MRSACLFLAIIYHVAAIFCATCHDTKMAIALVMFSVLALVAGWLTPREPPPPAAERPKQVKFLISGVFDYAHAIDTLKDHIAVTLHPSSFDEYWLTPVELGVYEATFTLSYADITRLA